MCHHCNYQELFTRSGLELTENRLRVLEVIGNNSYPLSAQQIYQTLDRSRSINRVTVYRILDLLVAHGLADRISTGGRAAYYGIAPNDHHRAHPHFYCKNCGQMDCLSPESLAVDVADFGKTFSGQIDKVEVRIDGLCKNCIR